MEQEIKLHNDLGPRRIAVLKSFGENTWALFGKFNATLLGNRLTPLFVRHFMHACFRFLDEIFFTLIYSSCFFGGIEWGSLMYDVCFFLKVLIFLLLFINQKFAQQFF